MVKYPGQKDAGRTESVLSENIDVAPTVLEACGVKAPASMQGKSLLTGGGREFVFSEGQYGTEEEPRIGYMLRTKRYKLLVQGSMENTMLFDLEKDPEELENVAEDPAYGEILAGLQRRLAGFCPVPFHREGISEPAGAAAAKAGGIGCAGGTDERVYPGAVVKRCAP